MGILWFIIMVIAAAGMIIGLVKERQGIEWGRPLTIGGAIVALLMAIISIIGGAGSDIDVEEIREREQRYNRVAGQKLGQYLAQEMSGKAALVIKPIEMTEEPNETVTAQIEGLKEGLGNAIDIIDVVSPPIPEEYKQYMEETAEAEGVDPEMQMEYEMYPMMEAAFDAETFNNLYEQYGQGTDLVITLAGLPMDIENMSIWDMQTPPELAVFGIGSGPGPVPKLADAIRQGFVAAYITFKPRQQVEEDKSIPDDLDAAFNKRYLLVTPKNVDALMEEYEYLLPEG